ncbi:MAG: Rab family GTPase [Promethearchaeota archaeon]
MINSNSSSPSRIPYTRIAKVIIIGDAAVGKTSLLLRYTKGTFNPTYIITIGVQFAIKDVKVGEEVLRLQIWDTGGQERFGSMRQLYYRGTKGALVVYDRSNPTSFERLDYWINELRQTVDDIPLVIVGNKADLPAVVSAKQGRKFAANSSLEFSETSAKTNLNITTPFSKLAQLIIGQFNRVKNTTDD